MGGQNKTEEPADWPTENEDAFLRILHQRIQKDSDGPKFKRSDWIEIDEELFEAVKVRYGPDRLRGKYNRLRIKHRCFFELVQHTGVSYDANRNIVYASEDVWQQFFQKGRIFKTFRRIGCKNYPLLGQVFDKSDVAGMLLDTEIAVNSDEERETGDHFRDEGIHANGKRVSEHDQMNGSSKETKKSKDSKYDFLKDAVNLWSSSLAIRKELQQAKMDKLRSSISHGCSSQTTGQNEAASEDIGQNTITDPYSIAACMKVINGISDLSDEAYQKASEQLMSDTWRQIFMNMLPERRLRWLKNLG